MTELEEKIRKIYEEADDWGPETDQLVQLTIGLSLTPTERLRWLETMQENFARWHGLIPADDVESREDPSRKDAHGKDLEVLDESKPA